MNALNSGQCFMNFHVLSHPQFFPKSLAPSRFSDHIHQMVEGFLEEVVLGWALEDGRDLGSRGGSRITGSHIKKSTSLGVCFVTRSSIHLRS